jgi:NADH-ubiquinone oxidoreductase chain 2
MLLALSINSVESIQAYIFYIITYTVSNLNAFIILLSIGYTFYLYVYKEKSNKDMGDISHKQNETKETKYLVDIPLENREYSEKNALNLRATSEDSEENKEKLLKETNNSPIQLISQLKGYFEINPYLALSLGITLFSFVGVPPLIGFFAKQMVLSAALDNGYVFMAIIAILTSVIAAVYYLNVIKQIFFFKNDYIENPSLHNKNFPGLILNRDGEKEIVSFSSKNIVLSASLTITISILTLILVLFIYIPNE